jgi:HD-GYP domain-containing protein (c-di-GMP phosphodiesterase class II)
MYDVLTSDRPYQRARSEQEARRLLKEEAGPHLDPVIVSALITSLDAQKPSALRVFD